MNIASYPAHKTLPNGWNAHVTIKPPPDGGGNVSRPLPVTGPEALSGSMCWRSARASRVDWFACLPDAG